MALLSIILASSLFSPVTFALPKSLSAYQITAAETWQISRLDMHMMSISTGIPGNPTWPDESRFDSTIDFDVLIPVEAGSQKWNCQGVMGNGTLIVGTVECVEDGVGHEDGEEGGMMFAMQRYTELGDRRPELSFRLWLFRVRQNGDHYAKYLQGATPITANDAKEPSSYLTCLQGRPYDGLRCHIKSYMSVKKELVIEGSAVD